MSDIMKRIEEGKKCVHFRSGTCANLDMHSIACHPFTCDKKEAVQ